jgi:hypothetical protein
VVALAPGAGAADEYDSPARELPGLRGGPRPPRHGAATRRLGRGRVVVYESWPGDEYYRSRERSHAGGLPSGWDAGLRRTAVLPARLARVAPPVSADREVVEVQRLDSRAGTAVVLLNWTGRPIPALTVRVRGAGALRSARSVESGEVTVRRDGADALVRLPLRDVDVLKLPRS